MCKKIKLGATSIFGAAPCKPIFAINLKILRIPGAEIITHALSQMQYTTKCCIVMSVPGGVTTISGAILF